MICTIVNLVNEIKLYLFIYKDMLYSTKDLAITNFKRHLPASFSRLGKNTTVSTKRVNVPKPFQARSLPRRAPVEIESPHRTKKIVGKLRLK